MRRTVFWIIVGCLAFAFLWFLLSLYLFDVCLSDYTRYYYHDDYYKCVADSAANNIITKIFVAIVGTRFIEVLAILVTGVATTIVAAFTVRIGKINQGQLDHSHNVERAYLNGGWGGRDATSRVYININNYGKTPAFVSRVSLKVVSWDDFQKQPAYPIARPQANNVGYNIAPNTLGLRASHVWDMWDGSSDSVLYGRLWYEDIFGDKHYSSFAIHIDGGAAVDIDRFPEYWKWT
jgi:hypothetical protein